MGNYNVQITNPKGETRKEFAENVSLKEAHKWLRMYRPAPIGWKYEVVNVVNPDQRKRKYPDHLLVHGFKVNEEGELELIDSRKARVRHNNGRWYTKKMAKRDSRALGATYFTQEKVWNNDQAV